MLKNVQATHFAETRRWRTGAHPDSAEPLFAEMQSWHYQSLRMVHTAGKALRHAMKQQRKGGAGSKPLEAAHPIDHPPTRDCTPTVPKESLLFSVPAPVLDLQSDRETVRPTLP